jgi:hypothetical protein
MWIQFVMSQICFLLFYFILFYNEEGYPPKKEKGKLSNNHSRNSDPLSSLA